MDRSQCERHDPNVDIEDYTKLQRQIKGLHEQIVMMQTGNEGTSVPMADSREIPIQNRQSFMDLQKYRRNHPL